MDFKLSENQLMIQKLARDFAQDVLKNRVEDIEAEKNVGHFPSDVYEKMCEIGFLGIPLPRSSVAWTLAMTAWPLPGKSWPRSLPAPPAPCTSP